MGIDAAEQGLIVVDFGIEEDDLAAVRGRFLGGKGLQERVLGLVGRRVRLGAGVFAHGRLGLLLRDLVGGDIGGGGRRGRVEHDAGLQGEHRRRQLATG